MSGSRRKREERIRYRTFCSCCCSVKIVAAALIKSNQIKYETKQNKTKQNDMKQKMHTYHTGSTLIILNIQFCPPYIGSLKTLSGAEHVSCVSMCVKSSSVLQLYALLGKTLS